MRLVTISAAALLCTAAVLAAMIAAESRIPIREMTDFEQSEVIGAATHTPGLCLSATAAWQCKQDNVECATGTSYCGEQQAEVLCAFQVVYENPTRCTSVSYGYLTCTDDDNDPSDEGPNPPIKCTTEKTCKCKFTGGVWVCDLDPNYITTIISVVQCRQ